MSKCSGFFTKYKFKTIHNTRQLLGLMEVVTDGANHKVGGVPSLLDILCFKILQQTITD